MNHSKHFLNVIVVIWRGRLSRFRVFFNGRSAWFETLVPLVTLRTAQTILSTSLLQHLKSLCKSFSQFETEFDANALLLKMLHLSTWKNRREYYTHTHSSACNSMTNWHGMMLLVSEWSVKSPLHNATIASVLRALAGSLFHMFGFFMDCLRTYNVAGHGLEMRALDEAANFTLHVLKLWIIKRPGRYPEQYFEDLFLTNHLKKKKKTQDWVLWCWRRRSLCNAAESGFHAQLHELYNFEFTPNKQRHK